jgi:hypothetical protein
VHDRDLLGVGVAARDRDVRVDEVGRESIGEGEVEFAKLVGGQAVLVGAAADRLIGRDGLRPRGRRGPLIGDASSQRDEGLSGVTQTCESEAS